MDNPSRISVELAAPQGDVAHKISLAGVRAWPVTRFAGWGVRVAASINFLFDYYGTGDLVYGDSAGFGNGLTGVDPVAATLPEVVSALRLSLSCEQVDRPRQAEAVDDAHCHLDDSVPLELRGIEVMLREDVAPAGAATGGTLLTAAPISGVGSLAYSASDQESGVARVEAALGDVVVAARDLAGSCAHADFAACPLADRSSLSVDTRAVPDGSHSLTLRVIDAAGNRHVEEVRTVDVRNNDEVPRPEQENALQPVLGAQLSARFAVSSRPSLTVPFSRHVSIRGRLSGAGRSGIGGASIDVYERATGAPEVAVGSARTRADGTFSYTLEGRQPSRSLRLAYGATTAAPLRLRVRAAATMKASLHGTIVKFSGRVLSRPLPRGGKLVKVQGTAPGFAWGKVATLRTDRRGHFSGVYRLAVRRPGVRLRFRVRVPTERGYPYLGYTGRPIAHRVP